jgi:hypothetical protein
MLKIYMVGNWFEWPFTCIIEKEKVEKSERPEPHTLFLMIFCINQKIKKNVIYKCYYEIIFVFLGILIQKCQNQTETEVYCGTHGCHFWKHGNFESVVKFY